MNDGGTTGAVIEGIVFFALVIFLVLGAVFFPFKEGEE